MVEGRGAVVLLPDETGEWAVPPADEPELTEADWQALVEWQIAMDPQASADPTGAEVAAAAGSEPMSVASVARLARVDVRRLDGDALTAGARGWLRAADAAHAGVVDVVEEMLRRDGPTAQEWVDPPARVAAAIGAALRLGAGAAAQIVTVTMQLAGPLGATRAALRRGDIPWAHVVYLAEATIALSDEHARAVEAVVLPKAADRTLARHRDAVRRAVDRVDPDGADQRRRQAMQDVALIRFHHGAGMGELFARMPSEELDTVYLGADTCARRWKAAGDPRTLDQLRVAALVHWARTFLSTGTADGPDLLDPPPADPDPAPAAADPTPTAPTRHGNRASLGMVWDLTSLLGITRHCGELLDSGATLPPAALAEVVANGVRVRRMLIDEHGHLVDLTRQTWTLPGPDPDGVTLLGVVLDARLHTLLVTGDRTGCDDETVALAEAVTAALAAADPALRAVVGQLLAAPTTADELDADPDADVPSAGLAEFVCVRDRHPTNPTAGPTAASAGDLDHVIARSQGGPTVRANLTAIARRWHLLKTHAGWTVRRHGCGWQWTSPAGDTYETQPYDYRLGP